ncbi:MAG: hypothetical protein ACE362_15855 [Phaeodactylibacter xiamenensis]|uniref:Uncharacterized protein n=1 Tax=Phaeodactylibacter xiamenensis TaxID=1524460 RepID=A0A098S419_9BACT|nr:hypothetical protein [Phaeodactylibacter xiamenensis]KGE87119.1 hypothetical protein IX84_15765 [Phaeodactylibacter xiamenensis]MCR9054712.1 hypothetical protein [bacterium]
MEGKLEINNIMKLIHALSLEGKLEIMNRLSSEIKSDIPPQSNDIEKSVLVDRLYGAWKDIDEDIFKSILESRTLSERDINLDA